MKNNLYVTLYHHRHGTSFALIAAKNQKAAEKKATAYWIEVDDLPKSEKDYDEYDSVEVSEVTLPKDYKP